VKKISNENNARRFAALNEYYIHMHTHVT